MRRDGLRASSEPARKKAYRTFPQPRTFFSARMCRRCGDPYPIRYTRSDLCTVCAKHHADLQRQRAHATLRA